MPAIRILIADDHTLVRESLVGLLQAEGDVQVVAQAADGIALARLIAQGKTVSDLITPSVPNRIVLDAPVVTKENVDQFIDLAFES